MKREDVERAIGEVALQSVGLQASLLIEETRGGEPQVIEAAIDRFRNSVIHARGCEQAMREIVGSLFDEEKVQVAAPTESDAAYRERLKRAVGTGSVYSGRLETATGQALDEIGGHYTLKRK